MINNILIKVFFRQLIILISILTYFQSFGQTPKFYLQIDKTKVEEGQSVLLDVILENINNDNIVLPDLNPFKIIQGPSTSMSTTIINGKRTSSLTKSYILLAPKKGKFTIPSATTTIGSKTLKSNSLTLEVVAPSTKTSLSSSENKSETFIRIEVADNKVFLGQQVVVNFVIYTRQNISSYNLLSEFKPEGFYSEPVQNIRDAGQKKVINGKEYYTQVIGRRVLYPQKVGAYTFGPIHFSIEIPMEGRSSFFFTDTKTEQLATNAFKLQVLDLPKTDDKTFCGGVGSFEMKAIAKNTDVSIRESIVIQLELQGDGDPKMIKAPDFDIPDGLEKYDPTLVKDEITEQGDKKIMTKVWEYIFIPTKDTIYKIQPKFTYFSPADSKYESILVDPLHITVTKGDGQVRPIVKDSLQISDFISHDSNFVSLRPSFWQSNWAWITFCLVTTLFSLGIFYKKRRTAQIVEKESLYSKAENVAKRNLEAALSYKNNANPKAFYEEISSATTGYILKKYNIPNSDASIADIKNHLSALHLPSEAVNLYSQLQSECELAKFANVYHDMDEVLSKAQNFISILEA